MFSRACGIARVGEHHVVALVLGHHLERELVVVAEEEPPLAGLRDRRRPAQDIDDRLGVLEPERHEDPGHEREVERHVALVTLPEVRAHVPGPLVRLGEENASGELGLERSAQPADHRVGLGQVLAARALSLDEVGDRVEAEAVHPQLGPEAHHPDDLLEHPRVLEVEVRLVREEAVPVERARDRVPGPVGALGVREDDPRTREAPGRCRSRRSSRARANPGAHAGPAGTMGAGRRCDSPRARRSLRYRAGAPPPRAV